MASLCIALLLTDSAAPDGGDPITRWTANGGQLVLEGVPPIPAELVQRLNRYQNVRSAHFVDWTKSGKSIYIRTRFAAIDQIHRVDTPGGRRQQLTWFSEPFRQALRRPRHHELAVTLDAGGGEREQIMLFDPGTGDSKALTDGQSRNRLMRWSRDGRLLAFQSTRRDGASNDVWIMDPDRPGSTRLLARAPPGSWLAPAGFSADGRLLLVQQFVSVADSRIYVLDLNSSETRLAAGDPEAPSANRALGFDQRGAGFYFITNVRGRAAELAWQPLEDGGEAVYITREIPWDVTDFAVSDDGRRAAFVTNEESASRLYLLDGRTRRYAPVKKLPVGLVYGLEFSPNGRRLAMNLNTAVSPSDVYVLQLGRLPKSVRSLERWTWSEVGGLDTSRFVRPKLVRYPTFDTVGDRQRSIPAVLYRPRGPGPHPVIIQVHGGPESQYRPSFSRKAQMWAAELGAAVIAPNIRGSSGYDAEYLSLDDGYRREDAVRDIGTLLEWIATQPDLDANRVAIYGASYGGYIVLAAAARYSDRLRAGIDVTGISNFVTFLENTEDYRRDFRRLEYGDERDPEMRAFLERISPLSNTEKIDMPLLVVQGENDPRVPASESEQIVAALRARGKPVWYIRALNEGHGYRRKENRDIYEQAAVMFLRKYLLGDVDQPSPAGG